MPESLSPADTIRRAAGQLRSDADRAERKDRSVMLHAHEARPIADLLDAIAGDMDFDGVSVAYTQDGDPELLHGETGYALRDWTKAFVAARALLGEARDA